MGDTTSPYDDEVVDPYSADDTKSPHDDSGDADVEPDDDEEPAPKKRGPGRPRKST